MNKEEKLPNYYRYLPFDMAVFIYNIKNGGLIYAIKSIIFLKLIGLIKWLAKHSKRFKKYLISKAKSPGDLIILQLFLVDTYNDNILNDLLKEAKNIKK